MPRGTHGSRCPPGAPRLRQGGWALQQLWLFWVAPIIGGVLGGLAYGAVSASADD